MSEDLKRDLIKYAKKYIKENCSETFYKKQELLDEIENVGLDDWQELSYGDNTDCLYRFIDSLEDDINESIRTWCNFYEKDIDKEFLLNLTTYDIGSSYRHSFFNNLPNDFPNYDIHDRHLSMARIPLKEFINYTKEDISNLPIYDSKLKQENKNMRILKIYDYAQRIKKYIDDFESNLE